MDLTDDFMEMLRNIKYPGTINHDPSEWNDEYFMSKFVDSNKIKRYPNFDEAKTFAYCWLKFYITGEQPQGLCEIMVGLLCSMTTADLSTKLIWSGMIDGSDSTATLVKPDVRMEVFETEAHTTNNMIQKFNKNVLENFNDALQSRNSPAAVKAWAFRVVSILNKVSSQNNYKSQMRVINTLGYLVLLMMRLCVKEDTNTLTIILSKLPGNLKNFWECSSELNMTPLPCDKAILSIQLEFGKLTPKCTRILTFIVATYCFTPEIHKKNMISILRAGCLCALSHTGLGCLDWLEKASKHLNIEASQLLSVLYVSRYMDAITRIRKFFEKFQSIDSKEYTWPWARLFEDFAFYDLSTKENKEITGILVAITTDSDENSHLWSIPQLILSLNGPSRKLYCDYAKCIADVVRRSGNSK